jgi:hypothetical protein
LLVEFSKTHKPRYFWHPVPFVINERKRIDLQLNSLLLLFRNRRGSGPQSSKPHNPLQLRIEFRLAWVAHLQLRSPGIRYVFWLRRRTRLPPLFTVTPRPPFPDLSVFIPKGLKQKYLVPSP